ncbi:4-hydroxy-tetrahydrodipicolinate reductase [Striga asiatica]|uniref:4-hydroxy-tetrahydrodipicolinate reductase n=1 Tax=Striga asiatica TaxID=4170 RepID=A0A5A7P4R0_STRAF|nr:4-hydroxy-tetrahydrodipicolinate reductase [Striga asiatica]
MKRTYSPGTSPVRYSGISDLSNSPSGKKILLSGPANKEWTIHLKRRAGICYSKTEPMDNQSEPIDNRKKFQLGFRYGIWHYRHPIHMDLPYHLASSSSAGVTGLDLGGAAFFFEPKSASVLKLVVGIHTPLDLELKLRVVFCRDLHCLYNLELIVFHSPSNSQVTERSSQTNFIQNTTSTMIQLLSLFSEPGDCLLSYTDQSSILLKMNSKQSMHITEVTQTK